MLSNLLLSSFQLFNFLLSSFQLPASDSPASDSPAACSPVPDSPASCSPASYSPAPRSTAFCSPAPCSSAPAPQDLPKSEQVFAMYRALFLMLGMLPFVLGSALPWHKDVLSSWRTIKNGDPATRLKVAPGKSYGAFYYLIALLSCLIPARARPLTRSASRFRRLQQRLHQFEWRQLQGRLPGGTFEEVNPLHRRQGRPPNPHPAHQVHPSCQWPRQRSPGMHRWRRHDAMSATHATGRLARLQRNHAASTV